MLVNIRYDRGEGWGCDENTANLIPELRTVLADTKLGKLAICVIVLACDPLSHLSETYEDDLQMLDREAYRSVFIDKGNVADFYKNKSIVEAMKVYRKLCFTPKARMRLQLRKSIKKAINYMDDTGINEENFKDYVAVLKQAPELINAYDDAIAQKEEDVYGVKDNVSGNRKLTYAEQKVRKGQKK